MSFNSFLQLSKQMFEITIIFTDVIFVVIVTVGSVIVGYPVFFCLEFILHYDVMLMYGPQDESLLP